MLKWLHIKNLALVDEADIEFSPGFNAVTGETGAGKSVLMGGVALLLGGRFDKSAIRQGTDRCEIAGEFRLDSVSEPQIAAILEECGLEPCEDSTLLVRRVFTPSGGRIFINSSTANAQLLRTIGELLVDVHSPDEAFGLMKNSAQLKALDRFAHLEPLLEQTAAAWVSIREIEAEQEEFQKTMPDADEAEHLRKTVSEIEKQSPEDGEDAQLEALHSAASNSKTILEIAAAASAALNESDDSIMDRLSSVRRLLRPLENVDPDYADRFLSKCDEISDAVSELTDDLQSRASSVELDESEFAALEERIQILQTLKRKYGPEIPDVLAYLENTRRRLDLFENSAREREQLESRMTQERRSCRTLRKADRGTEKRSGESGGKTAAGNHETRIQTGGVSSGIFRSAAWTERRGPHRIPVFGKSGRSGETAERGRKQRRTVARHARGQNRSCGSR